jgi:hypothetical protein
MSQPLLVLPLERHNPVAGPDRHKAVDRLLALEEGLREVRAALRALENEAAALAGDLSGPD